jgi:hypothetical protein
MAGVDDDQLIDLDLRAAGPGSSAGPDEIEMGSSSAFWQRRRGLVLLGIALLAAAVGGYAVGTVRADTPGPAVSTGAAPNGGPPTRLLVQGRQPPTTTGSRCSSQDGTTLQVGLEIVNGSDLPTTLLAVTVDLPLNGLRVAGKAWASCGQLFPSDAANPFPLAPGATAWITITLDVLVDCPAPLPVQVDVRYQQANEISLALLGGFSDLGDVPYTGCSTGAN